MVWAFGGYRLSRERAELVGADGPVHIEQRPLDLLILLVDNHERVVSKDEIVDQVWQGRIVSDATIATAVKQARKAVGDDGDRQQLIKTVHGRGYRFVAELRAPTTPLVEVTTSEQPSLPPIGTAKPSIAVLKFQYLGAADRSSALSDAIPAELISSLSRTHWLHIVARGSSFRFDPITADPQEIGNRLHVRYLIAGSIEAIGDMLTISVDLLSTADGELIWSERFATAFANIQLSRHEIVAAVIAALELHVPRFEADHARLLSGNLFDAWSHYHLGLRHIYRFNSADNRQAAAHFQASINLDPEFARAHAGLSFTYWQNAFMQFGDDRKDWLTKARDAAARAIDMDAHDPFASYNMGRAKWLEGDLDAGMHWLERALAINPNFAQCHYTKGLSHALSGASAEARAAADRAIGLSPMDPLYYGMLGTKAMSYMADEQFDLATRIADQGLNVPGAHFYIYMIAAMAHELSGDLANAQRLRAEVLKLRPDASVEMFFLAFPFTDPGMRAKVAGALTRLGFS